MRTGCRNGTRLAQNGMQISPRDTRSIKALCCKSWCWIQNGLGHSLGTSAGPETIPGRECRASVDGLVHSSIRSSWPVEAFCEKNGLQKQNRTKLTYSCAFELSNHKSLQKWILKLSITKLKICFGCKNIVNQKLFLRAIPSLVWCDCLSAWLLQPIVWLN